ncbi:7-carboxy-7-deazaguanine synthase QueE [Desulfobotulus mexicanus]|nr:7-carboxy-7-deazaguanine synthase QueE [Desulfobotulus mexicanus]
MLCVHELFHSIQGEGPFSGRPAVFLRLSGCVKPYCSFCDTSEALEKGKEFSEEKVLDEILSYKTSLVVITGGEPFLQWQTGLQDLESSLMDQGLEVQYESSGRAGIPENVQGKVVLSPKPGQWPSPEISKRAFALKPLMEEDPEPVLTAIQETGFPPEKIWLMALGASREEQLQRMPLLWETCRKHGYHFCPRLHILVHDRKKGV